MEEVRRELGRERRKGEGDRVDARILLQQPWPRQAATGRDEYSIVHLIFFFKNALFYEATDTNFLSHVLRKCGKLSN